MSRCSLSGRRRRQEVFHPMRSCRPSTVLSVESDRRRRSWLAECCRQVGAFEGSTDAAGRWCVSSCLSTLVPVKAARHRQTARSGRPVSRALAIVRCARGHLRSSASQGASERRSWSGSVVIEAVIASTHRLCAVTGRSAGARSLHGGLLSVAIHAGQVQQHGEPCRALDERAKVAELRQPEDQIAAPNGYVRERLSGHRLRRAADGDHDGRG